MMRRLLPLLLLVALTGCASTDQWPPPGSTVDYSRCKTTVIDSNGAVHHYDPVYNCTEYRNNDPNVPPLKQYPGAAEGGGGR